MGPSLPKSICTKYSVRSTRFPSLITNAMVVFMLPAAVVYTSCRDRAIASHYVEAED